jgi:hypothetical protein
MTWCAVWRNLLGHIADDEASDLDFEQLSQIEINGREIRTVIRLVRSTRFIACALMVPSDPNLTLSLSRLAFAQALALARCEEVPLNASHIKRTLAISQQFGKDLNAAEDW